MRVLKFGGTSVGSPQRIKEVISILKKESKNENIVAVFSAFSGITNDLEKMAQLAAKGDEKYKTLLSSIKLRHEDAIKDLVEKAKQKEAFNDLDNLFQKISNVLYGVFLLGELTPRVMDMVFSAGERLSNYIIWKALQSSGVNSAIIDSRKIIKTDSNFANAKVDYKSTNKEIKKHFKDNQNAQVVVVSGFIASNAQNEITTLGRGGSDFTASILAAALKASLLEIWTDVDGILTADPRRVKDAFPLDEITYEEVMELSYFGAKVVYPPTIQPVYNKIPIHIRNTGNPDAKGTIIRKKTSEKSSGTIKGITSINNITLLTLKGSGMIGVKGVAGRFFNVLAQNDVSVIMISQASSEHTISVAIVENEAQRAYDATVAEFEAEMELERMNKPEVKTGLAICAVVGENMRNQPNVSGKLFGALGKNGINIVAIAQGTSELNISCVIDRKDETKALNVVHQEFFLSEYRDLNVFCVGVGTVGNTFIEQIKVQKQELMDRFKININLCGISNSKKMVFTENGIDLNSWRKKLDSSKEKADLDKYMERMIELNVPNAVLVDSTANAEISAKYHIPLNESIAVATPNKIAASGDIKYYNKLKELSSKRGVKYLYETNVGAGLPVVSTLQDLIKSGDTIIKIEAILSGTLNYVFENISAKSTLSEIVKEAMDLGLTEPDPRIDLSGLDVARKILILAREVGYTGELKDVDLKHFIPKSVVGSKDIESFWKLLPSCNESLEKERAAVAAKGAKWRYVACFEKNKCTVGVKEIVDGHPFYTLKGSDNMVLFTTERYKKQPLVIQGPGAGAEVTAAGLFADVIRMVN